MKIAIFKQQNSIAADPQFNKANQFVGFAAPGILLKGNLSWGTGLSFHCPVVQSKDIQMSQALLPCVEVLRVEVLHLIQLLSEVAILLSCTYIFTCVTIF